MSRILVTGSTDGIGKATALKLLTTGHHVAVHARTSVRAKAVESLLDLGADLVVGDLSNVKETHDLAEQANELGRFDAVIHNAGTMRADSLLAVNVIAPYVLTASMERPNRLIYLSSSMHRDGVPDLRGIDWGKGGRSYSDSKLYVTTLMAAVARLWPEVLSHAVDPGWVPTKMGGPSASDDLSLAHLTQAWLAVTTDPPALVSGRYWLHGAIQQPAGAVEDKFFQASLLHSLAEYTGYTIN